jgi:hypothetical protein
MWIYSLYEGRYNDNAIRSQGGERCRAFSVSGFRQERAGARRPNKAGANDPLPLFIAGSISFIREQVSSVCNQKKTSLKKT